MVERCPNLKEEVGGSISGCELSSLPDGKLVRWSTASCALVLAYQTFVSTKKKALADSLIIFYKSLSRFPYSLSKLNGHIGPTRLQYVDYWA